MFIDTHAHLNFKAFNNDYEAVIERAQKADVTAIINVGSNLETSKKAIEIAQKHPSCYAAIGLHPIHVGEANTERSRSIDKEKFDETTFLKLAKHKKVIAIGETGLDYISAEIPRQAKPDYYHDKSSAEIQKEVFQKHLNIASQVGKPLIIHSREADADILSFLISQNLELSGVFHCFPGNVQMAKVVLDLGFYLSFTGLITFSKNYANLDVVKETPLEKLMIETDCPHLTPEPHRGERNEPAFVVEVAKKIAEIKKIPLDEVAAQTTQNAIELFKLELK